MQPVRVSVLLPSILVWIGTLSGCDSGIFVSNHGNGDGSVPAALDLRSCEILAKLDFEPPSREIRTTYRFLRMDGS